MYDFQYYLNQFYYYFESYFDTRSIRTVKGEVQFEKIEKFEIHGTF